MIQWKARNEGRLWESDEGRAEAIVADVQKSLGGFVGVGRNFGSGSEQNQRAAPHQLIGPQKNAFSVTKKRDWGEGPCIELE